MVGVPEGAVVHAQARPVAFTLQTNGRCLLEQAVEQRAALQGFVQRAAVDDRVAHHGEGATGAAHAAKAQVFVIQALPELLHQAGELRGVDACAGFVEQGRLDTELAQQRGGVDAMALRPAQGGAHEVAGDGTFAHGAARQWRIVRW